MRAVRVRSGHLTVDSRLGGELMRGIEIPQYEFALKMQGELMREGGVFAGHYGNCYCINMAMYGVPKQER